MNRLIPGAVAFLVVVMAFYSVLVGGFVHYHTQEISNNLPARENIDKYAKNVDKIKLKRWVEEQNVLSEKYKDKEISAWDFIDGNVSHFKEEKYAYEKMKHMKGEIFRTSLLSEKVMMEEWKYLTEKRKRWEIKHWLNSLESYKVEYEKELKNGNSRFWYSDNWFDENYIDSLEWLCYKLNNNINNWKLAYLIAYGIKSIDDAKYGPLNYSSAPTPDYTRAGENVTLHIVDYYSGESDCNGGNDIYMNVYIGSDSWTFTGPDDTDSWSGDATFTAYVTSSTVQITVHVKEDDSGLCGSDDDYGSFTITYNLDTKTWSGATSVPYKETNGDDGWCDVWFFVESDSDNNPREVSRGEDGAGYLITEYNGKSNYNDPKDSWDFSITQDDIANKLTIVFQVTPNSNADYDVYLYDPNGQEIASAAHVGDGVIETIAYRLSSSDSTGTYSVTIERESGYGPYTFHFDVRDMHQVSVSITGLSSETSTVKYYKFGTQRSIPLSSQHPFFEDLCDNQTTLTVSVPTGLYTYDNTSYYITKDAQYVVHFYRTPLKIVINEISSVGTGNQEWVELYNAGSENVYLNGWILSDQDGNNYKIPDELYYMPPGKYLVIYSGSGSNVYDFTSGYASLYTGENRVWNDDGDDVLLIYNGHYIDYVAYSRGSGDMDVDAPPSGVNFVLNGSGAWGCAPAPYPGGSISLIPNGIDENEASDWYVTNSSSTTPGEKNVNLLKVVGESKAPVNVSVGETNVYIEKLTFEGKGGDIGLNSINLHLGGNATDSDIKNVKLYEDSNHDGKYNQGDSLLRNTSFSSGIASFTNLGLTINQSSLSLFVLVDISTSYTAYRKVFSVYFDSSDITLANDKNLVFTNGTISSNPTEILPTDEAPPYVTSSTVNPSRIINGKEYVTENFTVDFVFNKDMMTDKDPVVDASSSYISKSLGYWFNSTTWRQEFVIYGQYEGNVVISISNAMDTAGNKMESYSLSIYVDTKPPSIYSHSDLPKIIHSDFNLELYFSENMDTTIYPSVISNPGVLQVVDREWVSPTELSVKFSVSKGVTTNVDIYVSNGRDMVGNKMNTYTIEGEVDTESPRVVLFSISPNVTLDGKIYVKKNFTIFVGYSETMNTSNLPQVSISPGEGLSMISEQWLDSRNVQIEVGIDSQISNRETIEISGATDSAGNVQEDYNSSFNVDNTPPSLSISLSRSSPIGPGILNVSVQFSEEVERNNTQISCSGVAELNVSGVWLSNTLWKGEIRIDYTIKSGNYTISVTTADRVGNKGSNSIDFVVDTTKPMAKIIEPQVNLTGPGILNVSIMFSEKMSQKNLHVLLGSSEVEGTWLNSTFWEGKYRVTDEYGPMALVVYGATDIAGNEMIRAEKNITIDTRGPSINNIICMSKVPEGSKIKIEVLVKDDYSSVKEVMLFYKYEGEPSYSGVEMVKKGDTWIAYIPKNDVKTPKIEFYVVATDSFGNEMTSEKHTISVIPWYIVNWWIWLVLGIITILLILMMIRRRKLREKAKEIPLKGFSKPVSRAPEIDSGGENDDFYE